MAAEPINIFARSDDPAGVARLLRERAQHVEFDGPDDDWRHATAGFGSEGNRIMLFLNRDPDYSSEPNWSTQMSGMRGDFAQFPETERKRLVLGLTTTFRTSLATRFEPDFDPDGDPRLEVLFAVAEYLDAVLFTPSALRDAWGRILFSAGGEDDEDPDAVWPRVVGEVPVSEPLGAAMHERSRPAAPDDDQDLAAPGPTRVARRALALAAVTARAIVDQDSERATSADSLQELINWATELGIDDEFEPDEAEVLQRPLGRLDPTQQINSSWRLEGLAVLAWALGRCEIPPHDQLIDPNALWRSLGLLDVQAASRLLEVPTVRPRHELATLRNRLFVLHWRLRNYQIRPGVMDFAEFAQTCWFGPLDLSGVDLVDGDLGVGGERIDRAGPDQLARAQSAARERQHAINWLWEGPDDYSEASEAT